MLKLLICAALLQVCFAPPATRNKPPETEADGTDGLEDVLEYHRYIKEVVKTLESDPTFRETLQNAKPEDIESGRIASELELVSHHIRTRLDELKRSEMHRLKELAARREELQNNELNKDDPLHHHIDHHNPHTFEMEDLKRLIVKTTEVLAEHDKKRREEFKEYELQKEYEKMEKLNHTNGEEERQKMQEEYKKVNEKHKKHEKLHSPGHKQHLEEVWHEQDHMSQDFNPKTFFMLHDLDGNGLWDQDEVKALFIKELDKMYQAGAPEDDMRERVEEMERMREAVFKEIDTNRDGFIDYSEFLMQTKRQNFQQDPGWKGLDEQKPFTDQELDEYVRRHNMQYAGGYQHMPPPGYPQGYQHGQMPPPGYHQGQPSHGYQQGHPQGHPQGQMPPQGYHHDEGYAQQQYHQGQMPPAGQGHGQAQGNMYPPGPGQRQMPPGGQAQMPPQGQGHAPQ